MAFVYGAIATIVSFFAGFFTRYLVETSRRNIPPVAREDLKTIYDQMEKDIQDGIKREDTIERLRKRLGL